MQQTKFKNNKLAEMQIKQMIINTKIHAIAFFFMC